MPGTKKNKHQPSSGNGYEMPKGGENDQEYVAKATLAVGRLFRLWLNMDLTAVETAQFASCVCLYIKYACLSR